MIDKQLVYFGAAFLLLIFASSAYASGSGEGGNTTTTGGTTIHQSSSHDDDEDEDKECPPCPSPEYYELVHTTHWHGICTDHIHYMRKEWNQNPDTCECFPYERELRVECVGPLREEMDERDNPRNPRPKFDPDSMASAACGAIA